MRHFFAWLLFTFAAVNLIATAVSYAGGQYCFGAEVIKLFLISAALWGWSRWK